MNNVYFETKNNRFNGYITKIHREMTMFGHINTLCFATDYSKFNIKENSVTMDNKPFTVFNYINKRITGVTDILWVDKITIVIKLNTYTLEHIGSIKKELSIFFDIMVVNLYVGVDDNKIYLEVTADYK